MIFQCGWEPVLIHWILIGYKAMLEIKIQTSPGLTLDDGLVYAGQILNGKPHGYGQIITSSGEKYSVVFKNGVETGIFHTFSSTIFLA